LNNWKKDCALSFRLRQSLPTTHYSDSYHRGSPLRCRFPAALCCRVTPHVLHRPHAMRYRPYPLAARLCQKEGLLCFLFARLCSLHVCSVTSHPSHQLSGILSPPRASPGPRAAPQRGHPPLTTCTSYRRQFPISHQALPHGRNTPTILWPRLRLLEFRSRSVDLTIHLSSSLSRWSTSTTVIPLH
jgi:hypothetical protein